MKRLSILFLAAILVSLTIGAGPLQQKHLAVIAVSGQDAGGDSQLYTDAVVVWDFENDATDTKGTATYTLNDGGANVPSYITTNAPVGTYWADFNGSDDVLSLSDADCGDSFDLNGDYAISFRLNMDIVDNCGVLSKNDANNGWEVVIQWSEDNRYLGVIHTVSWSNTSAYSTFVPTAETTYHIVISYNSTSDTLTFWVSGATFGSELNGTTVSSTSSPADSADDMSIGSGLYGFLNGKCDEVVIWNRQVNATEAQNIYNENWR